MCTDVAQLARSQLLFRYHPPPPALYQFPIPNFDCCTHTRKHTHTNCDICNESLSFVCFGIDFLPFAQSQIVFRKSIQLYRAFPGKLTCCHITACVRPLPLSPPLSIPLPSSLSLFFYVFLLVNRCWFVYLIDSRHTHTHTPIKESFVNLDLCSLPSFLPPLPSVCLFVCGPNALNFYFRLSQFTQANGKKYFSFGWLPCLACLLLTGPSCASNYARGASVCCYYVYVTLRYAYAACSVVSTV